MIKVSDEMTLEKEILELRKKILTVVLLIFFGLLFGMGVVISSNSESISGHPLFLLLTFGIGIVFPLMTINDSLNELVKKYIVVEKIIKRKEK